MHFRGCKRDDLAREFSPLRVYGQTRQSPFLNLSFAYRDDERENGVDGIQKEMGQSDVAEVATRGERSSRRDVTRCTDVRCEFIAKTGFLATARENNNKRIANNRKLSFPRTPGLR